MHSLTLVVNRAHLHANRDILRQITHGITGKWRQVPLYTIVPGKISGNWTKCTGIENIYIVHNIRGIFSHTLYRTVSVFST